MPLVSTGNPEVSDGGGGGVSEGSGTAGSCGRTVLGSGVVPPAPVSGVVCATGVVLPPPEPDEGAGLCVGGAAFGAVCCTTGPVLAVGLFTRCDAPVRRWLLALAAGCLVAAKTPTRTGFAGTGTGVWRSCTRRLWIGA